MRRFVENMHVCAMCRYSDEVFAWTLSTNEEPDFSGKHNIRRLAVNRLRCITYMENMRLAVLAADFNCDIMSLSYLKCTIII